MRDLNQIRWRAARWRECTVAIGPMIAAAIAGRNRRLRLAALVGHPGARRICELSLAQQPGAAPRPRVAAPGKQPAQGLARPRPLRLAALLPRIDHPGAASAHPGLRILAIPRLLPQLSRHAQCRRSVTPTAGNLSARRHRRGHVEVAARQRSGVRAWSALRGRARKTRKARGAGASASLSAA